MNTRQVAARAVPPAQTNGPARRDVDPLRQGDFELLSTAQW